MPVADKAFRASGIGGSDAPAVAGIDPWQSPYELYLRKRGELEPIVETEPMRWGKILEPVVAAEYARRTGQELIPLDVIRSERYPWMFGHIDRWIVGSKRILECKTTRMPFGWGEPGTDEIPLHYAAQVHHYLTVTGNEVCDIAVLIGGSDFRIYTVEADHTIAELLIEQQRVFWERVQRGEPPDPINTRDAVRRWGTFGGAGRVEAGEAQLDAVETLRTLHRQKSAREALEEQAKTVIMQALGEDGDTLVGSDGTALVTWKLDSGRKEYTVAAREPARRFLLKDE